MKSNYSYQRQISEFCDAFDKNADLINQILLIRDDYKEEAESLRAEVSELKKRLGEDEPTVNKKNDNVQTCTECVWIKRAKHI